MACRPQHSAVWRAQIGWLASKGDGGGGAVDPEAGTAAVVLGLVYMKPRPALVLATGPVFWPAASQTRIFTDINGVEPRDHCAERLRRAFDRRGNRRHRRFAAPFLIAGECAEQIPEKWIPVLHRTNAKRLPGVMLKTKARAG